LPGKTALHKLFLFIFIALSLTVIIASLIPGFPARLDKHSLSGMRYDYITHAVAVFLLIISSAACIRTAQRPPKLGLKIVNPVVILAAVILLEYTQNLIPWRTFNYRDMLSEIYGAALALPFYVLILGNIRKYGVKHSQ
jgi:VanZ family protein